MDSKRIQTNWYEIKEDTKEEINAIKRQTIN
jgi:hypothetical protein